MITFFQRMNGNSPTKNDLPGFYLERDLWNDYWTYQTMFDVFYVETSKKPIYIGKVKIGVKGMSSKDIEDGEEGHNRLNMADKFNKLGEEYFSVGQDADYYVNLMKLDHEITTDYFECIRDMSYNPVILNENSDKRVMYNSLLRDVTKSSVVGQFHRIANGGAPLTPFDFSFHLKGTQTGNIEFHVNPSTLPPTNIQVVIGRNGVGKSHLLEKMVHTILKEKMDSSEYYFESEPELAAIQNLFAGVVGISFSSFDNALPADSRDEREGSIKYQFVGVRQPDGATRNLDDLADDFSNSILQIRTSNKKVRWYKAINQLENDHIFKSMHVKELMNKNNDDQYIKKFFKVKLSSGHKIVLLTVTKLVELVEEKTLVLLDEPENHLHPPLLSAFTRALSELLVNRNGVAIVATHSPVVLQEVPKDAVWILNREGEFSSFNRPRIETFGENVGILTREVFRLELTDSGYHSLLKEEVKQNVDYESVLNSFNNQLGSEAKAIVRELLFLKRDEQ